MYPQSAIPLQVPPTRTLSPLHICTVHHTRPVYSIIFCGCDDMPNSRYFVPITSIKWLGADGPQARHLLSPVFEVFGADVPQVRHLLSPVCEVFGADGPQVRHLLSPVFEVLGAESQQARHLLSPVFEVLGADGPQVRHLLSPVCEVLTSCPVSVLLSEPGSYIEL